jgi:uncharacterized protein YfbU (UPF0304 family)
MSLTPYERKSLSLLLKIENLLDKSADNREAIEALQSGYQSFYGFEYFSDELSEMNSKFVMDVLQMYRSIQAAFNDGGVALPSLAMCPGFDGNVNAQWCGYVRYLQTNDRYSDVVGMSDFPNSHGGQPDYQRMLARFGSLMEGRHEPRLTIEEANSLIARD